MAGHEINRRVLLLILILFAVLAGVCQTVPVKPRQHFAATPTRAADGTLSCPDGYQLYLLQTDKAQKPGDLNKWIKVTWKVSAYANLQAQYRCIDNSKTPEQWSKPQ